jgi:hypothetical protein
MIEKEKADLLVRTPSPSPPVRTSECGLAGRETAEHPGARQPNIVSVPAGRLGELEAPWRAGRSQLSPGPRS